MRKKKGKKRRKKEDEKGKRSGDWILQGASINDRLLVVVIVCRFSRENGSSLQPKSAQEYIAAVPVTQVEGKQVRCDGGGGALGHPAVFINLNRGVGTCGYCGLRFQEKDHHKHH